MNIHFLNKTAKFFNGPSANHNKVAKDKTLKYNGGFPISNEKKNL